VRIQIFARVLAFVARTPRLMIVQNVINIFLFVGVSSEAKKIKIEFEYLLVIDDIGNQIASRSTFPPFM